MNIRSKIERILPAQPCFLCGAASHDGAWCLPCNVALPYLTLPACPVCALPTLHGAACGRCLKRRPHFQRTSAVFAYTFPLDQVVQALKFNEQLFLARQLAKELAQRITVFPDYIVPMPLHPARLRERGFNQSLELARQISTQLNIPLITNACQRVRDTPSQSALPWKARGRNMRKAFSCNGDFAGKHIAVVDDVMTSGATLNEAALALRRGGASEVSAWVVARTLPHR
ncbi:MAG: ComF family protein [Pseudomonadota bacterium]